MTMGFRWDEFGVLSTTQQRKPPACKGMIQGDISTESKTTEHGIRRFHLQKLPESLIKSPNLPSTWM
jgi:hypothetical protein